MKADKTDKKALDESTGKARLWNGNQYWDEKKKKWMNDRKQTTCAFIGHGC